MISYFYGGKGRSQLKVCEDSLTSIIFDTLKYLPSPIFWSILKTSLFHDKLPAVSGELIAISFWDKWDAENSTNSNYVEPDVFLEFAEFDIIIEAKRWNDKQQSWSQLDNQIKAYHSQFPYSDKKLFYIKLGGLNSKVDERNPEVVVCKTNWTVLLDAIFSYLQKIKNNDTLISAPHIRILEDCIHGFALHQFYKKRWLSDLKPKGRINHDVLKNKMNYDNRK